MNHNPYTPPTAPLEEQPVVAVRIKRPPAVTFALVLVLAATVVDAIILISIFSDLPMDSSMAFEFAWQLILLTFALVLCFHISRRRNWARVLLLVFFVLHTITLVTDLYGRLTGYPSISPDPVLLTLFLTPSVLRIAALCLLFGPARAWFGAPR